MKLLVCGGSDIFARRVLPGLPGLGVTAVDVASRSGRRMESPPGLPLRFWDDPEAALAASDADAVYVTTENSRHAPLALAALASGRHVIVDKPAFLDLASAERACELAAKKNLLLAEATVWTGHPRVAGLIQAFADRNTAPARIVATFSFPPLPPGNFRHTPELGGGALFDLGPYAVSPGRVLFGAEPEEVVCRITSRGPAVETAFTCLLVYPGGRTLAGTFGFDTGYVNRLDVLGPGLAASMDRAFTPPPSATLSLSCNTPQGVRSVDFEPADAFARFFIRAFAAMERGDGEAFIAALLADARTLARLRESAG
ncbi:Gfo/Idh/MocA family oxidoreductase [Solidesulfovibrio sp. C21]|uniref:Gfo/Idh/MocA family oxidoreductase n=1 Tax=Solidesulfovibrio sp. C21 TaxID=3398613 RepID=UPI0039FB9682